jgi:hypothetical protein
MSVGLCITGGLTRSSTAVYLATIAGILLVNAASVELSFAGDVSVQTVKHEQEKSIPGGPGWSRNPF